MRLAFYFTHCETLGHTTRIFSLARGLSGEFLFLQAGKPLAVEAPYPVVDLPHPFYSKRVFRGEKCVLTKEQQKERLDVMYSALCRFSPDVFFTEYFPFGREDCAAELVPILHWLKAKGVRIYAAIGYPVISTNIEKLEHYLSLFDKLFILAPKEYDFAYMLQYLQHTGMDTLAQWYEQYFQKHAEQICFVGYALPQNISPVQREPIILVSRGGGVIYPKIIVYGMKMASLLPEYKVVCVPGPASSQQEFQLFQALAKHYSLEYYPSLPSLYHLLAKCSVSVNMAGHGTVTQLFHSGTPSVLVPREKEQNKFYLEQRYRAYMAEQLGYGEVLSYALLTPELIANAVHRVAKKKPSPVPKECFLGAQRVAEQL